MDNGTTSRSEYKKNKVVKKTSRNRALRFIKIAFLTMLGLGALAGVVITVIFFSWIKDAPEIDEKRLKNAVASTVLDKYGDEYTKIGTESRDYVKYNDIPAAVREALLATEDNRFYKHNGIDIIRFSGALLGNIASGSLSQGGSTITQQVVKLSFLSLDKNIKRKVQEMYIAYQLEKKLTKEQIFEIYFNKVNMSAGSYGIGTAAKAYFNKNLDELTLPEIAYLVGVPQSPNRYNAFNRPELANNRKNTVLLLMKNAGKITEQEMNEAKAVDITTLLRTDDRTVQAARKADAFIDTVIKEVSTLGDYDLFSDGLIIHTTIDPKLQDYVEEVLESNEIVAYPDDKLQSGVVILDTKTSEVRAIGGWRKTKVERGFNYATALKARQPGSTIKPILNYAPAIEYIYSSSYWNILDEEYSYSNKEPVRNATSKYLGNVSMRTALEKSLNVPAVKTLKEVGLDKARNFAVGLGIELEDPIGEAAAIGGVSKGPSPYELAGAYASFGNNGLFTAPHTITKIIELNGTEKEVAPKSREAMKSSTAYMITDILKGVPTSGTGKNGYVDGLPMAAKTGTTNYTADEKKLFNLSEKMVPDAWYIGYTTEYTLSVWTGYPERKDGLTVEMQKIPALVFKAIMKKASSDIETKDFVMPKNVVRIPIVAGSNPAKFFTGANENEKAVYELFVKGKEPKNVKAAEEDNSEELSDNEENIDANEADGTSNNDTDNDNSSLNNINQVQINNLTMNYNKERKQVQMFWDVSNSEKNKNLVFILKILQDGYVVLQKELTDQNVTFNAVEGSKYTANVSVKGGNSSKSTSLEIPEEKKDTDSPAGDNHEEEARRE